jgi:xylan 1,4-beta-xylosidase
MLQWQLSGAYEELQPPSWIFKEGRQRLGPDVLRLRPAAGVHTYKLMNRLGDRRLQASGPALATRRTGGGAAVMVWNLAEVALELPPEGVALIELA